MPGTYRSMQLAEAGADFQLVEQPTPEPGRGQVRIAIEANGICHSDAMIAGGHYPGVTFPCVTGHEMAGRVDAIGDGVEGFEVGDRVGVGWFGGNCGHCIPCREGDAINCVELAIPGVAYPGGFADAAIVPATALARIPDELTAAEAAPMACAGVTVFNALRRSVARPGDLVAILGVGGLGHLGVQFASKLGFETVAIARGADKEKLARELGADHYIDATSENVAEALQALGGAKVVLATVTNSAAMSATIDGLTHRGELIVVGVDAEPIQVSPFQLVGGTRKVYGHASGTSRDVEETLHFAALNGVRPMIEKADLEDAGEAFAKMLSGEARFRMVLTTGQ